MTTLIWVQSCFAERISSPTNLIQCSALAVVAAMRFAVGFDLIDSGEDTVVAIRGRR